MYEVLISAEFFEKTKLKSFILCPEICNFWDVGIEPKLRVRDNILWGSRKIYLADFWQMTADEFLDFQTGVAAEVIIAACKKYKLDETAARELASRYPLQKVEFSLVNYEPTISPAVIQLDRPFTPLTNEEFAFPGFNLYQFCVSEPFSESQLQKIGPATLCVYAPVDLPTDQYVKIANAMHQAPIATLRLHGWGQGNDLRFLKYFNHVSRLTLDVDTLEDLSCLQSLSTELVSLELIMRSKTAKYSLDALGHFNNLQSLRLVGYCGDLSRVPKLASLKALLLSEVSVKNLHFLPSLPALQSFALAESKVKDMTDISSMTGLKYLELDRLVALNSMPNLLALENLEFLALFGLTKLTSIGSLAACRKLRRLTLSALKNFTNFAEVSEAPNLEELCIFNMKNINFENLTWIREHHSLKAFRTDDVVLEKAVGLKRGNTGKTFKFSRSNVGIAGGGKQVAIRKITLPTTSDDTSEDAEQDEEERQELSVHIKVGDIFTDSEKCNNIENRLEEILELEFLGRWSGHELGEDFYDTHYVGENSKLMFEALSTTLKEVLPVGSYIQYQDRELGLVSINY